MVMNDQNAKSMLHQLDTWAADKLKGEGEPPWSWYQLMKLRETCATIIKGMESTQAIHPVSDNVEVPLPM
jgi:hypothetical protein